MYYKTNSNVLKTIPLYNEITMDTNPDIPAL